MITLLTLLLACGDKEDDTTEVLDSGTNTDTSTDTSTDDGAQEEWIDGEWFDKGIYSGTISSDNKSYSITLEVHESGRNVDVTVTIDDVEWEKHNQIDMGELVLESNSTFNAVCSVIDTENDYWNFSCGEFANISAEGSGTFTFFSQSWMNNWVFYFEENNIDVPLVVNTPYEYTITSCNTASLSGVDLQNMNVFSNPDFCFEPIELTGNGFKDGFFINATFIASPPYTPNSVEYSFKVGN